MNGLSRLQDIVSQLRDECPWDRAQTPESMRSHLVEECYEVLQAIETGSPEQLKEELGDLLFQILLIARMHEQQGHFDMSDVAHGVADKMQRRHPHVFDVPGTDPNAAPDWEARKAQERGLDGSALDGLPQALPALLRAHRVAGRAARVGFEWPDLAGPRAKVDEELLELEQALDGRVRAEIVHEYGDTLLAVANMGRYLKVSPEEALREANHRFESRFRIVEHLARQRGEQLTELYPAQLDALWERAKVLHQRAQTPEQALPPLHEPPSGA